MFLAIDTDILLYKSAMSAETEIEWSPDIWTLFMDMNEAKDAFVKQLDAITDKLNVQNVICCLSDRNGNFRKQVDPTYKSNRRGTRKPTGYAALVDWVREEYETMSKPLTEADDIMGILSTMPKNKGKCIIVSDDKDMKTIPGKLYRPTTDEQLDITEQEADKHFLMQVLCGDPSRRLQRRSWYRTKESRSHTWTTPTLGCGAKAFTDAGMTAEDAITQARLARILRWQDWDIDKGEPILWTPQRQKT